MYRSAQLAKDKLAKEEAAREAAELMAKYAMDAGEGEGSAGGEEGLDAEVLPAEGDGEGGEGELDEEGEGDEGEEHDEGEEEGSDGEEEDAEGDGEGDAGVGSLLLEEGEEGGGKEDEEHSSSKVLADESAEQHIEEAPLIELTEEERLQLEQQAEEELQRQQSAGQKRMRHFLDTVSNSIQSHATHPRRKKDKFFIPMNFTDDIYYDPFETLYNQETENHENNENDTKDNEKTEEMKRKEQQQVVSSLKYSYYDNIMESPRIQDNFIDINKKLIEYRKEEEKQRKLLFATTLQEIPAKDWIRVFRTYTVDWDSFFANQEAMVELSNAVEESDREIDAYFHNTDPLKKITDTLSVAPSVASPAMSRVSSHVSLTSADFTEEEGDEPVVTLLPYGTILENQKIKQGDYRYYKIDTYKNNAMLTIEIKCLSGLVDMYLSYQKLPSMSMHERHIACTKQNKGLVRLAFRPMKSGSFFIAIRSHETHAKYNIWTYSSSGSADQSPIIERVSTILRKFEILATIDEKQLQEFYPKFEREAQKQVDEEDTERAIQRAEALLHAPPPVLPSVIDGDDESINELYDIESVGRFIQKVSKYTLMHDEAAELLGGSALEEENYFDQFQEFGEEIEEQEGEELFQQPRGSTGLTSANLAAHATIEKGNPSNSAAGVHLPAIGRGYSTPQLHQIPSELTIESSIAAERTGCGYNNNSSNMKLPNIHQHHRSGMLSGSSAAESYSSNTRRSIPRSKSSINVAREYASLDRALEKAMKNVPEKRVRVENPLLHKVLKPVKYQLRGDLHI